MENLPEKPDCWMCGCVLPFVNSILQRRQGQKDGKRTVWSSQRCRRLVKLNPHRNAAIWEVFQSTELSFSLFFFLNFPTNAVIYATQRINVISETFETEPTRPICAPQTKTWSDISFIGCVMRESLRNICPSSNDETSHLFCLGQQV